MHASGPGEDRLRARREPRGLACAAIALILALGGGCASSPARDAGSPRGASVRLVGEQTAAGVGAAQSVAVHDGLVYIVGAATPGVVCEFRFLTEPKERLEATGVIVRLARGGETLAPHPTGLTFHGDDGVFLGNTVDRKGTIFSLDWARAVQEGTLDHAVLNVVQDDLAVNGSRPEFVRFGGRWLVATSDYGPEGNEVRLYDPERLKHAARTSEPGVLVARSRCGPWVQSLCWVNERETLVLVQNQTAGLGYRLTFARLGPDDLRGEPSIDLPEPTDEFEGFALLGRGRAVLVSSSRDRNVRFGEVEWAH